MKWKLNNGFTIIEIVVVIAVIITVFLTVLSFFVLDIKATERSQMRLKAIAFAKEGIEGIRNFRDRTTWDVDGLGLIIAGSDYYLVSSSAGWDLVLGSEDINEFNRRIVVNRVSRDINDDIEAIYNPLNDDPDTKLITVVVSWSDRQGNASEVLSTYLTNWRN